MSENEKIDHNINGAFARAAWGATAEGQTETVYAMRVEYTNGDVAYWNVQTEPFTDEHLRRTRQSARRPAYGEDRVVDTITEVSRLVTISADEWQPTSDKN